MLNIDLKTIPFSRYGSYIAFNHMTWGKVKRPGLYLRSMHGGAPGQMIAFVEVLKGRKPVPFKEEATPASLKLVSKHGTVEICIAEEKVVRIRGRGVGLRLTRKPSWYETAIPAGGDRWTLNAFGSRVKYQMTPLKGRMVVDAPWAVAVCKKLVVDFLPDAKTGAFEAALEEYHSSWKVRGYPGTFDQCKRAAADDFAAWLKKSPAATGKYRKSAELAAYLNWACVVAPYGHFTRNAMLMSKNWMANVWSWDHCFNAMAQAIHDPDGAWDTMMLMFDNQDKFGAIPDSINDKEKVWAFCKPPIHGWALRDMMRRGAIDRRKMREIYEPLGRWTNWWMTYRDDDRNGLPQYNHGNDSGWDNATVFDAGCPVEGPDLAGYLVIQMDVLSDIAGKLGKAREARAWKGKADKLLRRMMEDLWRGDSFASQRMSDRVVVKPSDCLINFLPLVLGKRLPADVRKKMIAGLSRKGRLITRFGPATENPKSPKYEPDGYWRGPIWAPSTMVIVDGLARCGEKELARDIARRFCDMCVKGGFAENFDALTGEGLRDKAYTWTSSVFLVLAHDYLRGQ